MKKRVFTAINLPAEVKSAIKKEAERLTGIMPEWVRFMPEDNWHFTISFLSYQSDEDIGQIVEAMQEAVPIFPAPEINFSKLLYGPPNKEPRMIWIETDDESSKKLGELKNALENALANRGIRFERETRRYHGHITLARFEQSPLNTLPAIDKKLSLGFSASSLDLMELRLHRTGAEYEILTAVDFSEKGE